MANLLKSKKILATLMIFWFGPVTLAQWTQFSNSSCITRLSKGVCSKTTSVNYKPCCEAIKKETHNEKKCMCEAFTSDDHSFLYNFKSQCAAYSNVLKACPGLISIDISGTMAIVIPIVIIVVIAIIIAVYCYCKKRKVTPNGLSNNPGNGRINYLVGPLKQNFMGPPVQSPSVFVDLHSLGRPTPMPSNVAHPSSTSDSLQYQLETLKAATNNFSDDNVIGTGGFGSVYKGTLRNGLAIAVKRLSNGSSQGDKEFTAEIELLGKLQHNNLVRLLGCCKANSEALLVYEFVLNKSLDYFLFDSRKREELTWSIRFNIIRGIAKGIFYLHADAPKPIIHRDLKAANVLLDANMAPKIADFGLARICSLEQTHVNATRAMGTQGYMAPEYLNYKQFSIKSDVYAFGVLVLEIASGRRTGESLMIDAWRCWGEDKALELIDPLLKDLIQSEEVRKCIHIGLLCVQHDPSERPDMSTINHMLHPNTDFATFPTPRIPDDLNFRIGPNRSTTSTTASLLNSATSHYM